jgi:hypothetical protein
MNYPPDSFWLLIESDKLDSQVLNQDSSQLKLDVGRWHCLPDQWRVAATRLERESQSAYSSARVKLWPVTLAPARSS